MIGHSGVVGTDLNFYNYDDLFKRALNIPGLKLISVGYKDNNFNCITTARDVFREEGFTSYSFENEDYVIILDGYLQRVPEKSTTNIGEYILKLWIENGDGIVEIIDGEYNISIYNKKNHNLHIINDRVAARSLFYYKENNKFFFGSEKKFIFSAMSGCPEIDEIGVMEFFMYSHNIKDRTIFKGIKALPPASILQYKFESGKIIIKNYWKPVFESVGNKNRKDLLWETGEILITAARERFKSRKNLGMGLSGGLDSRVIALSAAKINCDIFTRTYGSDDSIEVKVAKKITDRLGFDHITHKPSEVHFSKFLYPTVWRTECSVHFTGLKSIIEHGRMKDQMWYNLDGAYGDILSGKQLRPFMFLPSSREGFINNIFRNYTSYTFKNSLLLKQIFNPVFFKENFFDAKNEFYSSFNNIDAKHNWDLYDIWDLQNRQTRFTFSSSLVDNHLFAKIKLFTDFNYIRQCLSIPGHLRFGQLFYKTMISSYFPEFNDIKNSNTLCTLKKSDFMNLLDIGSQYYNKKIYPRFQKTEKNKCKVLDKANLFRADPETKNIIFQFLDSTLFPDHIFSKKGIYKIVEEHYAYKQDYKYLLGVLLTFIAAYDMFIINNYKELPIKAEPYLVI